MQFTNEVGKLLGCSFERQTTGHADYVRVFIRRSDGATIGRATIYRGNLQHIKWYKARMSFVPFDESDDIELRMHVFMKYGTVLTDEAIAKLKAVAIETAELRKQAVIEARKLLPGKSRSRVTGPDPRKLIYSLI